jgi:hypothetical protein
MPTWPAPGCDSRRSLHRSPSACSLRSADLSNDTSAGNHAGVEFVDPGRARPQRKRHVDSTQISQAIQEQQEWKSIRPPPRKERPTTNAIPYTKDALQRDLERVRDAWDDSQADRRRGAIYGYLKAVYDLVSWWSADGSEVDRARQALRSRGFLPWPREDAYAAMIRCTADPARADKRTRSKWSRVLRYAKMEKDEEEALAAFIKRNSGINECNARHGRCLRRLAARRSLK